MKLYLEGNTSEVLTNMGKKVLKQYLEALAAMSSALSKQLGKYDMYSMIAGMVFVFQVRPPERLLREPGPPNSAGSKNRKEKLGRLQTFDNFNAS